MIINRAIPGIFLSLIFFTSCVGPFVKYGEPGKDYLNSDFSCRTGVVGYERTAKQTLSFEAYRKKIFQSPEFSEDGVFAVITGDSTGALFHRELLDSYLPEFEIFNRSIPGDTTLTLQDRFDRDVMPLKPRILIMVIGGNDILNGRCLPEILENTKSLIEKTKKGLPRTKIVLVSVPPVVTWKANSISPFYNRKLEGLAQSIPNTVYMDLWTLLAEEGRPILAKEYRRITPDGTVDRIHFNDDGYRKWAELLRPLLSKWSD